MPSIPAPKLVLALLLASGTILAAGTALGQKPAPLAPPGTAEPGKPPALGTTPAPLVPAPRPPMPPAVQAPAPAAPAARNQAPLPPPPADEDPAIRRLRATFGANVQMAYQSATVFDSGTGRFQLSEVTLRRPDGDATIGTLTVDGQREDGVQSAELRNLATTERSGARVTIEHAQIAGLTVRRPAPGQTITPDAVSIDRFTMEGLRIQGEPTISVASLTLEDYGPGRPTRLRLETLAGERAGPGLNGFSLARLAVSGIDVASIWTQLIAGGTPDPLPGRFEATAENFALTEGGRQTAGAESLRIESETDQQLAGTGRATLRGLRLDGIPQLQAFLTQLGYQSLTGDVTMEAGYQPQGGRMTMPSFLISAPGFGSINLSMDIDGIDRQVPPEQMAPRIRLLGMALRYRDEGLLPRVLRMQAAQQRVNEGQLREQIIGLAGAMLNGPATAALREPIERFVRGQAQELEIAAHPPQPVPLMAMGAQPPRNADEAQRRFGLTATAR